MKGFDWFPLPLTYKWSWWSKVHAKFIVVHDCINYNLKSNQSSAVAQCLEHWSLKQKVLDYSCAVDCQGDAPPCGGSFICCNQIHSVGQLKCCLLWLLDCHFFIVVYWCCTGSQPEAALFLFYWFVFIFLKSNGRSFFKLILNVFSENRKQVSWVGKSFDLGEKFPHKKWLHGARGDLRNHASDWNMQPDTMTETQWPKHK